MQYQQIEPLIRSAVFQAKLQKIKIAVLDTGVYPHPSLKGAITSTNSITYGFNFSLPLGQDTDRVRYDPNDFKDRYIAPRESTPATSEVVQGHGTGIASIIAGSSSTDGFLGVAPGAQILPIKVCEDGGNCDAFQITAGICQAIQQKVHVINLSLSGPEHCPAVSAALSLAVERGITVVTAAGNYEVVTSAGNYQRPVVQGQPVDRQNVPSEPRFPISYGMSYDPNIPTNYGIIGVGAAVGYPPEAAVTPYSRRVNGVKVVAPGADVLVASLPEAFVKAGGTSYAAAWVSGLAALLKAKNPNYTPYDIAAIIQWTATKLRCYDNIQNDCGNGMINFTKALEAR
jgi:subtilisin family serine protease